MKDINPKGEIGINKIYFSTIPANVIAEIGTVLLEGARKYGRHNYRVAVIRNSVYYDAALRHLTAWWEGEDIDPDSGLNHVTKALSALVVLRDAQLNNKTTDDRPPSTNYNWIKELEEKTKEIIKNYPNAKEPYIRIK